MDSRHISGSSDQAQDGAGVNLVDEDTDHITDIVHNGDADITDDIGHDGDTSRMDVADVSHSDETNPSVDISGSPADISRSFAGKEGNEPSRISPIHHHRQNASHKSFFKERRLYRFSNQRQPEKNLQAAKSIIIETNWWMVRLLHTLRDTVKASSASQRLPSLSFLNQLPVFTDVQRTWILDPLGTRSSRSDMMEHEIRSQTQSSIQALIDELYVHRDTYHQNVTPELSLENTSSNPSLREKDMNNIMEQEVICIEPDSQSSIESLDNIVIDFSDEEETVEHEIIPVNNIVINLGDDGETAEQDTHACL